MAEEITEVVKAINNIAAAIRETVNEEMHLEPYGVNEEKSIKDQGEIQAIACMSQAGKKRKMSVPPAIQERSWCLRRTAPPSRNMTGSDVHTLIGAVGMGDHEARGDDLEKKADKKLSGWGLFGNKYSDAANLLDNAGNFFKLAKNCLTESTRRRSRNQEPETSSRSSPRTSTKGAELLLYTKSLHIAVCRVKAITSLMLPLLMWRLQTATKGSRHMMLQRHLTMLLIFTWKLAIWG